MDKKIQVKKIHNRILEISPDSQQITMPDSRYYKRNGEYYPSITYILQSYPKGKHFEDWLKKVGYSADYIVRKAGEDGTQVHEMIEDYLNGKKLEFLYENFNPRYHPDVWGMFLHFVEWWELYKPNLITTEVLLFSDEWKVAGTADLICEINGELWVIDFKTSNLIHTTYELQAAVYGKCYEECFNKKPTRHGILWLKSSKRKASKDRMQGRGWEMIESFRSQEENLDLFLAVKKIFDIENPLHKPSFTEFKTIAFREF